MALEGKQILITSGGTVEKWDQVRGHTNLAKGTIGCYLAEQALARGADVTYLHGYFARVPERHHRLRVQPFEGVADLREKIRRLLETEPVRAVIMAAAVSDWVVEKIVDQEGRIVDRLGKIPSDQPPVVHFRKADKIITAIKKWKSDLVLVGFKLEHTADEEYLLARANERMTSWQADVVVANASSSLHSEETLHYIVSRSGDVRTYTDKRETAKGLLEMLERLL